MSKEADSLWDAVNRLKQKHSGLCARLSTLEGKMDVILGIGTTTLIAVIGIFIGLTFGGR